jgi:hypothetical protein
VGRHDSAATETSSHDSVGALTASGEGALYGCAAAGVLLAWWVDGGWVEPLMLTLETRIATTKATTVARLRRVGVSHLQPRL